MNRLTNGVDARGTTRYTNHANGQLLTEDGPLTYATVTYAYNDARLRQSMAVQYANNTSSSQTYGYTARRLTSVVSPAATFSYTGKGAGSLMTNLALPTGGAITNDFDSAGRWLGTWLKNSGGTLQNSHTYVYSAANRRTNQTQFDNSYVRYAYGAAGQLTWAKATNSSGQPRSGGARIRRALISDRTLLRAGCARTGRRASDGAWRCKAGSAAGRS